MSTTDPIPAAPTPGGLLGLNGLWLQICQGGAICLICVMFYQDRHESMAAAREDRNLFRQELKEQRQALQKMADAVEQLTAEVGRLKRE